MARVCLRFKRGGSSSENRAKTRIVAGFFKCNIVTVSAGLLLYNNIINSKGATTMSVNVITKDNFDAEVLKETKPVLLDFWASWCGPCRMVSPIIDEIANERADLKVGKVNVDEQPELAAKFGVMSIPTLIVMKDGKVVNQTAGARPKPQILSLIP
jgi:thioredoxin 1